MQQEPETALTIAQAHLLLQHGIEGLFSQAVVLIFRPQWWSLFILCLRLLLLELQVHIALPPILLQPAEPEVQSISREQLPTELQWQIQPILMQ